MYYFYFACLVFLNVLSSLIVVLIYLRSTFHIIFPHISYNVTNLYIDWQLLFLNHVKECFDFDSTYHFPQRDCFSLFFFPFLCIVVLENYSIFSNQIWYRCSFYTLKYWKKKKIWDCSIWDICASVFFTVLITSEKVSTVSGFSWSQFGATWDTFLGMFFYFLKSSMFSHEIFMQIFLYYSGSFKMKKSMVFCLLLGAFFVLLRSFFGVSPCCQ